MNKYLVFGAAGSIGREVVRNLQCKENWVVAAPRRPDVELEKICNAVDVVPDVSDRKSMQSFYDRNSGSTFDGVIYLVGHCPPDGFPEAIKYSLSELPLDVLLNEINMHQVGVLTVFQAMLPLVEDGGCFVFMSSAITRLTDDRWPPFLQAHYHAAMIAAEDWLIRGMRFDPMVRQRQIKIHRLAPGAVNTPFHRGGLQPPRIVSVDAVVSRIVNALKSKTSVDEELL